MRLVLGFVFWVGLFSVVREWRNARKHGLTITLVGKLLLALALPFGLAAQLAVEEAGFAPESGSIVMLVVGAVLNGWALKRRIQRKTI